MPRCARAGGDPVRRRPAGGLAALPPQPADGRGRAGGCHEPVGASRRAAAGVGSACDVLPVFCVRSALSRTRPASTATSSGSSTTAARKGRSKPSPRRHLPDRGRVQGAYAGGSRQPVVRRRTSTRAQSASIAARADTVERQPRYRDARALRPAVPPGLRRELAAPLRGAGAVSAGTRRPGRYQVQVRCSGS